MAVYLLSGDDESILISAVNDLVRRLVGDGDRGLMVDEFDGAEYTLGAVADAAQTPSFLTERRIVVARGVGRFTADEVAPLVAYLSDPLPTADLVLVAGGGRMAKSLTDAIKAAGGETVSTSPPSKAGERKEWVSEQARGAGVALDASALTRLASWLGEDAGRLAGVLDTLRSTYGEGTTLKAGDVEPFLGEAGGVPPWELTDAIDGGNTTLALQLLHRMMHAGERHPLAVLAILHGHYARLLALDGLDVRDETAAAAAMGIKPGFPARKALGTYRALGSQSVARAVRLLAQADLDLKGAKDLAPDLVAEVLVARLSKLAGSRR